MAGKAGKNATVVKNVFEKFRQQIDDYLNKELEKWSLDLVKEAVFERLHVLEGQGHNFTGNLINSIVVIYYRQSTGTKQTFFGSSYSGKPAIRRELSARNAHGRKRVYKIHFRPGSRFGNTDWEGQWSTLKPETLVPTDESFGRSDAIDFANRWQPRLKTAFEICVAYTSEYAKFVEEQRRTTGFLNTMAYAERTAVEWIGLH